MKKWIKYGLIIAVIAVIPLIIGLIADSLMVGECLGCLVFFFPSIYFGHSFSESFMIPFSFVFNIIVSFIIGAIIGKLVSNS